MRTPVLFSAFFTLALFMLGGNSAAIAQNQNQNQQQLNELIEHVSNQTVIPQTNAPVNNQPTFTNKVGQMIMVGFQGTTTKFKGVRAILEQLREGSIGGVMLMKHNIKSIKQVRKLTAAFRQAARDGGQLPPLISVDQEGGQVQRLKFHRYPSAKKIARKSTAIAAKTYRQLACEVRSAGINLNFGPVADLDIHGRANPIIGRMGRSYGSNPQKVSQYARQFVLAHKRYGLMTAAKHFPGHGSSLKDSHKGFTAIPQWRPIELQPFAQLASGNASDRVDFVMVGHLYNKNWGAPASLSRNAVAGMLRQQVGFQGVAITDDMEMGAIRKNYKWTTALKKAVNAGNDIVLYSNTVTHSRFLGRKIRNTILQGLCSANNNAAGCIPDQTIANAYARISTLKTNAARKAAYKKASRCQSTSSRTLQKLRKKKKTNFN